MTLEPFISQRRARRHAKDLRKYEHYSKITWRDLWAYLVAEWDARKVRHVEPVQTQRIQGES